MEENNQACLVLIKPDGLIKSLTGNIINELSRTNLKIIATKIVSVDRALAEKHYSELSEGLAKKFDETKAKEIFEEVLKYITGEYHTKRVLAMIYYGENAIEKVRAIAGITNPEEADPTSIRGRYGRIHSKTGVFENVLHASDSPKNAEKEIKLWFNPAEIVTDLYPTETKKEEIERKVWN